MLNIYSIIILLLINIFLGLLIYKIENKLSSNQVILLKFRVLFILPIISIFSQRIRRNKKTLNKMYRYRNRLTDYYLKIFDK